MSPSSQAPAQGHRSRVLRALAITAALLSAQRTPSAAAEERFVIAAPPLGGSALDYEVWLALSRRAQKVIERAPGIPHPAAEALSVCVNVLRTPVARAPSAEANASLAQRVCSVALEQVAACRGARAPEEVVTAWERGFTLRIVDAAETDCGALADARTAIVYGLTHGFPVMARAVAATLPAAPEGADGEGRQLLSQAPCERARDLRRRLATQKLDEQSRGLSVATSEAALEARWGALQPAGARYQDVLAYHLAEATLELRRDAQAALGQAGQSRDPDDAQAAVALATCLGELDSRDSLVRRARQLEQDVQRASRRVQTLQEESEPRECCKVCSAGYACGNSCISRSKQCHQPPGCACDG